MGTIVEATVPAEQFALAETLRRRPSTEFEAVRVVADDSDSPIPFLWATAGEFEELSAVVDQDPSTRTVHVLTTLEDECLFRVEWTDRVRRVRELLVEQRGALLEAHASDDSWTVRILFPEHDAVAATYSSCEQFDLQVTFERIYDLSRTLRRGRDGLTEGQYETILTAFERGYYDVPREATLADLADELDVSHQALSERLRRGHATLVERALNPEPASSSTQ